MTPKSKYVHGLAALTEMNWGSGKFMGVSSFKRWSSSEAYRAHILKFHFHLLLVVSIRARKALALLNHRIFLVPKFPYEIGESIRAAEDGEHDHPRASG